MSDDEDPAIKTPQFPHQREIYLDQRDSRRYALFHEMGLGKSKTMMDVASHKFMTTKKIDALVVVAPKSVYTNWLGVEAPIHLAAPYVGMCHHTKGSRGDKAEMKRLVFLDPRQWSDKLKILCVSYPSLLTDVGFEFLRKFMIVYRTMMIVDESTAIKRHKNKSTKAVKTLGKLAHVKWIATGTPVANKPFDVHSQVEFLDEDFWGQFGMKAFGAFKTAFGVYSLKRDWRDSSRSRRDS